jgi:hypothetical protein
MNLAAGSEGATALGYIVVHQVTCVGAVVALFLFPSAVLGEKSGSVSAGSLA